MQMFILSDVSTSSHRILFLRDLIIKGTADSMADSYLAKSWKYVRGDFEWLKAGWKEKKNQWRFLKESEKKKNN